jgi:hypothetical protein
MEINITDTAHGKSKLKNGPRRALTPEQTSVRLMANQKTHIELELLKTTEWAIEESN